MIGNETVVRNCRPSSVKSMEGFMSQKNQSKTARKTPREQALSLGIPLTPADHPIYKLGFVIGGTRLSKPRKQPQDTGTSPDGSAQRNTPKIANDD